MTLPRVLAELETVQKERDEMREAIEAAGLSLEAALDDNVLYKSMCMEALALLAPWRQKPSNLPPAAKV